MTGRSARAGISRDGLQVDRAELSQVAQTKGLVDALHDALSSLTVLIVGSKIGMQSLGQFDIESLGFGGLGRQPALRRGWNVWAALPSSRSWVPKAAAD